MVKIDICVKNTLGILHVLFLQVKKQAQYMTPDQAVLSLDPSNHEWYVRIVLEKAQKGNLMMRMTIFPTHMHIMQSCI